MPSISPPWVNLASLAIGGFFYGLYFLLYVASTYLIVQRSKGTRTTALYRSAIFVLGVLLFISITGNWIMTIWHNVLGFIVFKDGTAAPEFFNDTTQVTSLAQNIFVALSMTFGDSMIIFRLWIVWSRNKYPHWALTLVIAVESVSHVSNLAEDLGVTPFLVFTLFTNVYSTGFIAYKLWKIAKESSSVGGTNLRVNTSETGFLRESWIYMVRQDVLAITVESASIYTAWAMFYIITHQINSNLQIVALMPLPAVVGIANASIQARVGLGKTIESRLRSTTSGTLSAGELRFMKRTATDTEGTASGSRSDVVEFKPAVI
ncbi:hypothetical protein C8R45DRAFT_1136213 [Mycena sanguinolenta]|nr:hypothetical protein C8R45DRAFT_1136213 [Mycena sanguinolenta]